MSEGLISDGSSAGSLCPAGFKNVVKSCIEWPTGALPAKVSFSDAVASCTRTGMVFALTDPETSLAFDLVLQEQFKGQSGLSFWLGFERADASQPWISVRGDRLPPVNRLWAPGQPSDSGNCLIADQELGFKLRAVNCQDAHSVLCQPKRPNCPTGYEWVEAYGNSCFKTIDGSYEHVANGNQ